METTNRQALIAAAEAYLNEGINVIGVSSDKRPIMEWRRLQSALLSAYDMERMMSRADGLAVITGHVSSGLECIDFDAHGGDIDRVFNAFTSDSGVAEIMRRNRTYVERSPRGGYHIIYRYDAGERPQGNTVLARWGDGQSMIETRGEGGYVIVAPTAGYKPTSGALTQLDEMSYDEREYLLERARTFNERTTSAGTQASASAAGTCDNTDPVSWFNWHRADYAQALLIERGWTPLGIDKDGTQSWRRPGKTEGTSATWGRKHNALYVFSSSVAELQPQTYYTPFQLLVKLRFNGNYMAALHWVVNKYFNPSETMPYIRVGTDYYKRISKTDRFGIERVELKPWRKDEIKQDHGKQIFDNIPKFDDFDIEPNNIEHTPVIGNCYNLYKEFVHKPAPGAWRWSEIMLRHVFGEQYELGLRYMQALYLHPKRMLPILVLVSKERQTGKTTFINWLNMIFGANMVNINPEDLASSFNASYATANIIAVEETLIEKSVTVEKLKSLATGKFLSVNQKFVNAYKVPFYGKIILASNNEDKFAKIDEEEIRFFVRKLTLPRFKNHNIEEDLRREIPAFLHYLTTRQAIDWSRDRSGFTPDEIVNDSLMTVKAESKTWLYKELVQLFTDLFNNHPKQSTVLMATPKDIKDRWYRNNSRVELGFITTVLKNEFKLQPSGLTRYLAFDLNFDVTGLSVDSRVGRPYIFTADMFEDNNL